MRNPLDQSLGAQLGQIVAKRGQGIFSLSLAQGSECRGVKVLGGELAAGRDIGKTHQRMHHGQLPRVIQLEAGYPSSVGKDRGFGELAQLTAADEGLHHVLLDVVVVVDDLGHAVAQ